MVAGGLLSLFLSTAVVLTGTVVMAAPYDDTVAELGRIAAANADLVTPMDIGVNDQGTPIQGLRIEGPANFGVDRPAHLVVGTHHGNEQLSATVALRFTTRLLNILRDPTSPLYASLAGNTYYVVPVLNVSGYNAGRREETSGTGRSLDPNRDYPDPCTSDAPFLLSSTRNIADFIRREDIVAAVTIHGYIGTFTYPWGIYTTDTKTPDDLMFKGMTEQAVRINGYEAGTHADVIYPTAGAFEDWAYYELGVWVTLLEIVSRPDFDRDADTLLKYFSVAPRVRSNNHQHLGECRNVPNEIIARP